MRVKCVKCNMVEDISGDNLDLLAKMISMYNPMPKASDYTAVLSVIKGDCIDREKHVFSFEDSFYREIDDIRNQYEDTTNKRNICDGDLLKIDEEINMHISEIRDLENKAKEIDAKIQELQGDKDIIIKQKDNVDTSLEDIMSRLQSLTGIKDIKMWT